MISEVSNALLLTFFATEYLIAANDHDYSSGSNKNTDWKDNLLSRRNLVVVLVVGLVNIFDRLSGLAVAANGALQGFLHLPRIGFAAAAYVVALFIDCRRVSPSLQAGNFLRTVGLAFLYVLPVYPFLAVLISFVFMVVIRLFEVLNLPLEWLNAPIYYGTLYGPFSFVYFRVKQRIVHDRTSLPSSRGV
jgi:hypothetical protein